MFARVSARTCVFVSSDRKTLCEHGNDVCSMKSCTQREVMHASPARPQRSDRPRGGSDLTTQQPSLTRPLVQLWDPALSALEDVHKAQGGRLTYFHTETSRRLVPSLQPSQKYGDGVYHLWHRCNSIYGYIWIWARLPWRRKL